MASNMTLLVQQGVFDEAAWRAATSDTLMLFGDYKAGGLSPLNACCA